jgi:hypothetical protein
MGLSRKTISSTPLFFHHPHPSHRVLDPWRILRISCFGKSLNLKISDRILSLIIIEMGVDDPEPGTDPIKAFPDRDGFIGKIDPNHIWNELMDPPDGHPAVPIAHMRNDLDQSL